MNDMKNRITQSLTLFVLMVFIFSGYGFCLAQAHSCDNLKLRLSGRTFAQIVLHPS
jgi:hypothetical protein